MEKFEFEKFVEDNKLDISKDFSTPIQKQVKIFNELREKREDTIDEDREEVDKKLKERALKILTDMESEMEDRLANNDIVEVEKPKEPKPEPKKEVKKEPEPKPQKEEPKPAPMSNDEQIIEQFFKKGIYKVGRSELIEKGFKGKLEDKEIKVGKYLLSKFRFSYNYAIKITKK